MFLTPFAFVSPLAGVYVDKWNVKATMIASNAIRGILVASLLFVRDLYAIYVIFLALSTVSSFFVPAQSVGVRALTPVEGLMAVNALLHKWSRLRKSLLQPSPVYWCNSWVPTHASSLIA